MFWGPVHGGENWIQTWRFTMDLVFEPLVLASMFRRISGGCLQVGQENERRRKASEPSTAGAASQGSFNSLLTIMENARFSMLI